MRLPINDIKGVNLHYIFLQKYLKIYVIKVKLYRDKYMIGENNGCEKFFKRYG